MKSCFLYKRILALAVALLATLDVRAESFKIVVIPDTQWAAQKWPDLMTDQARWIVENQAKEDIKYVLHVGDMVQVGSSEEEWKNFDKAMTILEEAKLPYILAVGNHDYDRLEGPKSTVLFNRFFPVDRIAKNAGFGGNFPEGKGDNSYSTFEAGGKKWLILSLNFYPADEEIAWGNEVVSRHADHQVIILTHSYLTHTQRDTAGEILWERLVRHHPNISMAFCGHLSTVHFRSEGDHGNTVCEMLFDWQNDRDPDPNSYLAIVTIDTGTNTISSRSYSPTLDHSLTEGRTGITKFENVVFKEGDPAAAKKSAESIAKPRGE